ncbi:hypothetical protein RZR97_04335 [Hydrogenimonas thermophila]|uniref:c-type cytochrome n=1 Tax=Hydrogenimonas thermophila TaxID=223786 RepID=UPI002936E62D|nr:hypothetical protein [Hydrogenimonas thermophila]WOE70805.1 hypothetical protein RZR91_04355 [Hydrogenimonas thermophila]WOE73323.1 hypothetical protein RZR97_04335 [Hydrogenimonas thermophila]
MYRYISIIVAIFLVYIFTGCNDKEEQKKSESVQQIKITKNAVKKDHESKSNEENSGQFYYSYNKEKKSSAEEAEKRRTTLDAYLNIRSPYERVQIEMLINRLSHEFIVKCSPCHDDYANGVIGPSLLDKDGEFIYKRLIAFKTGEKNNVLMKQLVSQIDDAELKSIAEEISEFNKQIRKMRKER